MNKIVFGSACTTLVFFVSLYVRQGSAILCWDCNSSHDPRCGEYNFDNRTIGATDCSQLERNHLKGMQAMYCRKIIQRIGDEVRVIRGCGWLKDDKAQKGFCYTRTGTKDVMVTFCQCEGDRCNGGATLRSSITAFAASLIILVKLF